MNEKEQIYSCAVRYGLGRMTYITGVISDFMMQQELSKHCKEIMIRDIEECENYGHQCDKDSWMKLLDFLKEKPITR